MSTEERSRILRMVAEGKITAEEAADLLEAIELPRESPRAPTPPAPPNAMMPTSNRSLVIQVFEKDTSRVNVRIPLSLARAAGKFIPRQAQEYLNDFDINLKDILESVGNPAIIGNLVEVRDDDTRVRIAVE